LEKKAKLSKNKRKLLLTFGTIIAVYIGMKYLLPLFVPFLFAYFIAWLLRPVVGFLHRKLKIPLVVGGGFGVLLLLLVISVILCYLGRILFNQVVLFLRNIPIYQQYFTQQVEIICVTGDKLFGFKDGSLKLVVNDGMDTLVKYVQANILPKMTIQTIKLAIGLAEFLAIFLIILVATILIIKDMEEYKAGLRKSEFYPAVHKITQKLSDTGIAYMKTQMILMSIIAVINAVGFFILKNPYALLIGLAVGIFDGFPVLGSGLILIPWAIVSLIQQKFIHAAVIMSIFLLCQIVREILEPKLLGDKIGVKPIYSMIAMYIGVQLFGVIGFFLGPLSLVIIKTVIATYAEE
jgi:sporulation integral membrane protein YtvI